MDNIFVQRRSLLSRVAMSLVNRPGPLSRADKETLGQVRAEMDALEAEISNQSEERYQRAFVSYLRNGLDANANDAGLNAEDRATFVERMEMRDMGTGGQGEYQGATQGFFAPLDFSGKVESSLKDFGPMFRASTLWRTRTGSPAGYPSDNDTSVSGELLQENQQTTQQDVAALGQITFKSYKFGSRLIKISVELLQDAGFDVSAYLAERIGIRIARAAGPYLTTGSGVGQPTGIITGTAVGRLATGTGDTLDGVGLPNTIGLDDLNRLVESVDQSYRDQPGAGFMMNSSTISALRRVTDRQSHFVFPGLHMGNPPTIFGYPVFANPNLDSLQLTSSSPTVTRNTILFGALSRFVIRMAPLIVMRLATRFADFGQVAFVSYLRLDSATVDQGSPYKLLVNTY